MTASEYQDYQARVARFFEREGVHNHLSPISDEKGNWEEYFSWRPCDCCGSPLGGNRIDVDTYRLANTDVILKFSVCTDCLYYAEYGQLDDMTMMEICKSQEEVS